MTTDSVRQEKGDLISRNDAIEVINKLMEIHFDRKVVLGKVWQQIKDLPSAQKKGKWLYDEEREATGIYAICSCCDEKVYQCGEWLFCPRCGADMRGDADG